jgi:hypothetical protein
MASVETFSITGKTDIFLVIPKGGVLIAESKSMGAGILANWFALSLANLTFALLVRSVRNHSVLAGAGSLPVSFLLLGSHAFWWVGVIAELVLVLFASILAFRRTDNREWR